MRGAERRDAEFTEFVRVRTPGLFRSAMLLTTDRPGAEDLVQSTWVKAYVGWARVCSAADPVAYLHGILIKTFQSQLRRRSAQERPLDPEISTRLADGSVEPDPALRLALLTALRELSPLDRAVVVLRHWEDRSVEQTAAQLGLSEAAVKNRSLRSLRTLRDLLADHLTPADDGSIR